MLRPVEVIIDYDADPVLFGAISKKIDKDLKSIVRWTLQDIKLSGLLEDSTLEVEDGHERDYIYARYSIGSDTADVTTSTIAVRFREAGQKEVVSVIDGKLTLDPFTQEAVEQVGDFISAFTDDMEEQRVIDTSEYVV